MRRPSGAMRRRSSIMRESMARSLGGRSASPPAATSGGRRRGPRGTRSTSARRSSIGGRLVHCSPRCNTPKLSKNGSSASAIRRRRDAARPRSRCLPRVAASRRSARHVVRGGARPARTSNAPPGRASSSARAGSSGQCRMTTSSTVQAHSTPSAVRACSYGFLHVGVAARAATRSNGDVEDGRTAPYRRGPVQSSSTPH